MIIFAKEYEIIIQLC